MHFRDLAQVKQNMDRKDPYIKVNNFNLLDQIPISQSII